MALPTTVSCAPSLPRNVIMEHVQQLEPKRDIHRKTNEIIVVDD